MIPLEERTIQLQEGPQRQAGESLAQIIFYGGAAGSGKTFFEVFENAKYFDDPTYGSVIFRRTKPELRGIGSIWDECLAIYPLLGADMVESRMEATFPSGARVKLDGLEHDKDKLKYQGKSLSSISFDELTHFLESQFWFLVSRVRGFKWAKILATMNPDPDSWVLKLIHWWIGEDGFPIQARSGVVRFFVREGEDLRWFDTAEEVAAAGYAAMRLEDGHWITRDKDWGEEGQLELLKADFRCAMSFTFISAKIWDNPALLARDPGYLAKLQALPAAEQARLLGGNWAVRLSAGDYFQESWMPIRTAGMLDQRLKGHPLDEDIIRRFRCWDLASTPHKGDLVPGSRTKAQDEGDPDWTIGLLVGETRKGLLVILDCKHWRDTSGEIEKGIIRTAEEDPKGTIVLLWQDPGQAGPYQIQSYVKALRGTARVEAIPARQNKQEYAQLPSRTANKGRILVQKAEWNRCFFSQLTGFPKKGLHDDCVDALSLACTWIWDNPRSGNRAPQTIGEGFAIPAHVNNDVRTTARFRSL